MAVPAGWRMLPLSQKQGNKKWSGNYPTAALPVPCSSRLRCRTSFPQCYLGRVVLSSGGLCFVKTRQNNSQRSVYVQNKGHNVKDESNHFPFLCLYFTALWKAIPLFLQPQSHCIHCSAPSCLPSVDPSSSTKAELVATRKFHFGKIQSFKIFRSKVRIESQNHKFSNP